MQTPQGFGVLLKHYRLAAGLSQEALAARASLSARTISDLERSIHSAPRADTLALLIDALALAPSQQTLLLSVARPTNIITHAPPSTIPLPPNSLLGREKERTLALTLLRRSHCHLLTLTGPSGVGKTRLAVQLAHDLINEYDLVVYVPLAPVLDATLIPPMVVQMLGIHESVASSEEQVRACLQERSTLLVFDNVEQVLDIATFITYLLTWCPHLTILVTSRVPLRLLAEQELLLASLPSADAVQLFCERAQAIRPSRVYPLREVAAICARVDDLPLAIEIAAMKLRSLSLSEVYQGLTKRLAFLRNSARDLPKRQQTMENAIAWSYELLTDEQQRYFRALGVFIGGWRREAADAIWGEQDRSTEAEHITLLASLVDASLIYAEIAPDGAMRFGMLELLRDYALQELHRVDDEEYYRRKHAVYYAHIAEHILAHFGPEQGDRDTHYAVTLAQELPNARAALQWAEAHNDAALGLRLTGFARLWHVCGQMSEAEYWFERMLALDQQAREQGLPTAPLTQRIAMLSGFGRTLVRHGQIERGATACAQESLHLAQSISDYNGISTAFETLGMIAQVGGLLDEAQNHFESCYEYAQGGLVSRALAHLAELAQLRGDLTGAMSLAQDALLRAQAMGTTWDVAHIASLLGKVANQQQHYATAKAHYRDALRLYRSFASPSYLAACLDGFATVVSAEGCYAQATRLYAVTAILRAQAQIVLTPPEHNDFKQRITIAKSMLDESTFAREWEKGRSLSQDEAVEDACRNERAV